MAGPSNKASRLWKYSLEDNSSSIFRKHCKDALVSALCFNDILFRWRWRKSGALPIYSRQEPELEDRQRSRPLCWTPYTPVWLSYPAALEYQEVYYYTKLSLSLCLHTRAHTHRSWVHVTCHTSLFLDFRVNSLALSHYFEGISYFP